MLLASSADPGGPKSTSHFLVLHHGDRRDLVRLPQTFSDLKQLVESLCRINPERFFVETKDLNICAGERIRIPAELWGDIAELLGNVYVVVDASDSSHPESRLETNDDRPSNVLQATKNLDQQPLYKQILSCDPNVPAALETIRTEVALAPSKRSSSGVKWPKEQIPINDWSGTNWKLQPYSVFVIRYTFSEAATAQLDVGFGPRAPRNSLAISIFCDGTVEFGEHNENGKFELYHTITLPHPSHSAGSHYIALVHHHGKVHVIFDFKQSTVLPRTTVVERKPTEIYPQFLGNTKCSVQLDLYEFS